MVKAAKCPSMADKEYYVNYSILKRKQKKNAERHSASGV